MSLDTVDTFQFRGAGVKPGDDWSVPGRRGSFSGFLNTQIRWWGCGIAAVRAGLGALLGDHLGDLDEPTPKLVEDGRDLLRLLVVEIALGLLLQNREEVDRELRPGKVDDNPSRPEPPHALAPPPPGMPSSRSGRCRGN